MPKIEIRVRDEFYAELKEHCAELGVSVSEFMRQATEDAIHGKPITREVPAKYEGLKSSPPSPIYKSNSENWKPLGGILGEVSAKKLKA